MDFADSDVATPDAVADAAATAAVVAGADFVPGSHRAAYSNADADATDAAETWAHKSCRTERPNCDWHLQRRLLTENLVGYCFLDDAS